MRLLKLDVFLEEDGLIYVGDRIRPCPRVDDMKHFVV